MVVFRKNETYIVHYKDDKRPRSKELQYLGREGSMLVFLNVKTNKKEVIPSRKIIRWEATKEEKI